MIFLKNIRNTCGDVALAALLLHCFLSINLAGNYTTTLRFLFGTPIHSYRSAFESMTNPRMKLTIMIAIHLLKTIQKKIISLKLHLSICWNHQQKISVEVYGINKLKQTAIMIRTMLTMYLFWKKQNGKNASSDSSYWNRLSEFSDMDSSIDNPDSELWSIAL